MHKNMLHTRTCQSVGSVSSMREGNVPMARQRKRNVRSWWRNCIIHAPDCGSHHSARRRIDNWGRKSQRSKGQIRKRQSRKSQSKRTIPCFPFRLFKSKGRDKSLRGWTTRLNGDRAPRCSSLYGIPPIQAPSSIQRTPCRYNCHSGCMNCRPSGSSKPLPSGSSEYHRSGSSHYHRSFSSRIVSLGISYTLWMTTVTAVVTAAVTAAVCSACFMKICTGGRCS